MKALKVIGIILLALIGIVLILGMIAPKELSVSRSIVINAPQQAAFNTVNDLTSWEAWSPWKEEDPSIKTTFGDKTSGLGASSMWTSDNSGAGKMTITEIEDQDKIAFEMEFDGNGGNLSNWLFKPTEDGTEVTWDFNTVFPFPINGIMMLQGFEGIMIENYDRGLAMLKTYVEENLPEAPKLDIQSISFAATNYLVNRQEVAMADMESHFQSVLSQLGMAFAQSNTPIAGAPAGLYYTWDMENQISDMALGIPAAAGTTLDGLTAVSLPAGPALMISYVGDYSETTVAHEAMDAYMKANNLTAKSPVIERYLPDPGPESMPDNPEKWVTEIVYLLEK